MQALPRRHVVRSVKSRNKSEHVPEWGRETKTTSLGCCCGLNEKCSSSAHVFELLRMLFRERVGSLGGGALLEEVSHRGQTVAIHV